jgi:hypothetical protein
MTPWLNFSTLRCNNITPNALKMYIREVWFKHFENFNPLILVSTTVFEFQLQFFVFYHENSQIKI